MAAKRLPCTISGCNKPRIGRGWCSAHYRRWRKYGDPLASKYGKALEFFHNVVLPYEDDDCLIWPFSRSTAGYAQLWFDGRSQLVSRLVCEHVYGPAPTDKHEAAHSCGKGHLACCNPHHLRWKTPKENQDDKIIHGTTNRGERCGTSKLTEVEVRKIRKLLGTRPQREIATMFGVSRITINHIKNGRAWRHLKD